MPEHSAIEEYAPVDPAFKLREILSGRRIVTHLVYSAATYDEACQLAETVGRARGEEKFFRTNVDTLSPEQARKALYITDFEIQAYGWPTDTTSRPLPFMHIYARGYGPHACAHRGHDACALLDRARMDAEKLSPKP
jgi:hypothetical protein